MKFALLEIGNLTSANYTSTEGTVVFVFNSKRKVST